MYHLTKELCLSPLHTFHQCIRLGTDFNNTADFTSLRNLVSNEMSPETFCWQVLNDTIYISRLSCFFFILPSEKNQVVECNILDRKLQWQNASQNSDACLLKTVKSPKHWYWCYQYRYYQWSLRTQYSNKNPNTFVLKEFQTYIREIDLYNLFDNSSNTVASTSNFPSLKAAVLYKSSNTPVFFHTAIRKYYEH